MIPEQTIAEILERVDLVKLVGRQVKLRKAGAGFMGLCPFHDEKSPSFSVSPVRRTYHCFGCGAHGDAVRFLMEQHGRSFPEAVRELAAEVGVMVPEERPEPPARRAERERQRSEAERLFAAQDAVTTYYTDTLFSPAGEPAQRYLTGRGFTPDTARAFRLGYADGDAARFQRFLATTDVALADLVALGLLLVPDTGPDPSAPLQGHYLRFRRRLMCPVVDVRGQVTGYSGRVLDAKAKAAKYVNSPETPVFTKGDQLYGAFTARSTARRAGRVILCEGNLDVVALWQAGFPGTVAAMGTALTTRQVRLVKRLSEQVICVMDGDAAGAKAAFASLLPFLEEGIQPRAVLLTGGHDPDSYVREHGADAFRTLLAAARPLLDLYIEREAAARPADALGRAEGLRALAPALRLLQDPLTRDLYRQQVASTLGVPLDFVDRAIQEAAPAPAPTPRAPAPPPAFVPAPPPDFLAAPPPDEPPPMWEDDEAGAFMDLSDGPDAPPAAPPVKPMPKLPRYERELAEYIADFPDLAVDLVRREGHKYLTHEGLADFLVRLCREVESDAVLDEDRLLREFPDAQVVAFWRERQARPSGLDRTHARRALHDAVLRLEHGHWKRQRKDILRRLGSTPGQELSSELAEVNRRLTLITRRLSTPTTQTPAEGAN